MRKIDLRITLMLVIIMTIMLLSTITHAEVDIGNIKYKDNVVWSDFTVYSSDEILLNNAAKFNITQFIKDLKVDMANDPINTPTPTPINTPTPTPINTPDLLTVLSLSDDIGTVATNWDSTQLTEDDRNILWSTLSDDMKVGVWIKLKSVDRLKILSTDDEFPMETVCLKYGKKEMLTLWNTIKFIQDDDIYNSRIREISNISNFDKYRMVGYLNVTNIKDKNLYLYTSGYELSDNLRYASILPQIANAIATKSNKKIINAIQGNVILFESYQTQFNSVTMINDISSKVGSFMKEYNNKIPIR